MRRRHVLEVTREADEFGLLAQSGHRIRVRGGPKMPVIGHQLARPLALATCELMCLHVTVARKDRGWEMNMMTVSIGSADASSTHARGANQAGTEPDR